MACDAGHATRASNSARSADGLAGGLAKPVEPDLLRAPHAWSAIVWEHRPRGHRCAPCQPPIWVIDAPATTQLPHTHPCGSATKLRRPNFVDSGTPHAYS